MGSYVYHKKLLLLQKLQQSQSNRLAKKILEEQITGDYYKCWYSEVKKLADTYMIDLNKDREITKGEWKKTNYKKGV